MPFDEHAAAELIAHQYGCITTDQLRALGLSSRAITGRVAAGRLIRVAPSVYAFAPFTDVMSWYSAAVLTCGPDTLLSHASAGAHYRIDRIGLGQLPPQHTVHVTVARQRRGGPFWTPHRTARIAPRDRCVEQRIPITSVERTIVDLGSMRTAFQLADIVHEATFRHDIELRHIYADLRRRAAIPHRKVVLDALAMVEDGSFGTRSELEDRFVALLIDHGIRIPTLNMPMLIGGERCRIDAIWRDQLAVIELDGLRSHGRARTKRSDLARTEDLVALGHRVLRLGWHDVTRDGARTARRIRAFIGE